MVAMNIKYRESLATTEPSKPESLKASKELREAPSLMATPTTCPTISASELLTTLAGLGESG